MQEKSGSISWLIVGAFAVIYIVWGSTYLANLWAIQSIPPFLMAGIRFFTAGSILYIWTLSRGAQRPSLREWRNAGLLGLAFLTLGTGGVVWAEQYIDSGMAALVVSSEPLIVLLLMWGINSQKPSWLSLLGVAIGIIGTILLVGQPEFTAEFQTIMAVIAVFIALISWGIGSIYVSKFRLPKLKLQSSAMQMLAGGTILMLIGSITGEWQDFDLWAIEKRSLFSWLYLVFFGSILAFSCFNYLLTKVSPAKVATATYVHPVVALFLGWGLNNEIITGQSLMAGALMLLGVFFINKN